MQAAKRMLLARTAAVLECSTSSGSTGGVARPWAAGFAKKAAAGDERGSDTKIQKLLKVLEPAEVEEAPLSAEELAEAERRCVCEIGVGCLHFCPLNRAESLEGRLLS